jgi:hypothetical protein
MHKKISMPMVTYIMMIGMGMIEMAPTDKHPMVIEDRVIGPAIPPVIAGQQRRPTYIPIGIAPHDPGGIPNTARHPDPTKVV